MSALVLSLLFRESANLNESLMNGGALMKDLVEKVKNLAAGVEGGSLMIGLVINVFVIAYFALSPFAQS